MNELWRRECMNQVFYFSRSGNTKKIADAIAEEMQTNAIPVSDAKPASPSEYLFLGSGCYGGKPSPVMMKFIKSNDFSGKKIGLFGTSGSGKGSELIEMKTSLEEKGAKIQGTFSCKGKTFFLINRKHPSTDEMNQAKQYARNLVKKQIMKR